MRNFSRKIATAFATVVVAVGIVTVTSIPAHASSDTSWGYIKAPTSSR